MTMTIDENWLGLWTLYWREVRRFAKVYNQTILAPVVTTLLFLRYSLLRSDTRPSRGQRPPTSTFSRRDW